MQLRSTEKEIMDDFSCNGKVLEQTLRELDTINSWLGGNSITVAAIVKCCKEYTKGGSPIVIADIGCGSASMLILIAKWARKNRIPVKLVGVDANFHIVDIARSNCEDFPEIDIVCEDICSPEFKLRRFDIVVSTLFLHHFDDAQLQDILGQLKQQTNVAIIINDIHRHWFAYYSILALTQVFSRSIMVKNDASLSVLKAFKKSELITLAVTAGFSPAKIEIAWRWAFRFQAILDCRC